MSLVKKVVRRVRMSLYWRLVTLSGFIVLACLNIIKPFKFVKLVIIHHERMGHLAGDVDFFLRSLELEKIPKNGVLYIGISGKPCNQQLLRMFKRKLFIIENALARAILRAPSLANSKFCIEYCIERVPNFSNEYYVFNNTEPNLHFTTSEEERGKELLKRIGIEDNSWFVCFHSRDPAYLSNQWNISFYSSRDWRHLDFRDCDVKNYLEAAKYIASLSGFAVRMGHGVTKKLPDLNNPRIIDYASYHRTDFGDIYLLAKCKFFLANTTGLLLLSTIFHVPVACANFIRFDHTPFRKGDLYIPKKIWSIKEKRFLTFREILDSEVAQYILSEQYAEAGLEVMENTAEEILELAVEMNEHLDGKFEYAEEDKELQSRFRSLFQPHHRAYGSPVRIGAKFLRQNKELLK